MRMIMVLCVVILSFTSVIHVEGLQSPRWDDVCDPNASPTAVNMIGRDVISQVCGEFNQCLETTPYEDRQTCTVPLYVSLLNICTGDDIYCKTLAALRTAAILQGEDDGDPLTMIARLAIDPALNTDLLSDYVDFFQTDIQPNVFYFYFDPVLHLAAGATLEYQGEYDTALEVYTQIISGNPLLYFRRGQLYGALGETDLASIDSLALRLIAEDYPIVQPIADSLSAQYPFDASRLQDWLVYRDQSFSSGVGGDLLRDLSLTPPTPVQLGFYENGRVILMLERDIYGEIQPVVYSQTGENSYVSRGSRITINENIAVRDSIFEGFESGGTSREFLAAEGQPDPRPNYERCENGARWRLMVGSEGRTPESPMPTSVLYDAPNGNALDRFYYFVVVDGPVCVESVAWWEIIDTTSGEESEQTYWIPEAFGDAENGFSYETEVTGDYNVDCPTALQRNLSPVFHSQSYVLPEVDEVNVYVDPTSTSERIATMHSPEGFYVLDGPVCVEGNLWWRIDYNGVIGWFKGDDGERYFATNYLPPED